MNSKPTSQRVRRELNAGEQKRLDDSREEIEAKKDAIIAEGRVRKHAWEAMRRDTRNTIAVLKARREQLGLTLADVEARSGLKRSALSRLEHDQSANPTMLTLQRYAEALGMTVVSHVEPST